MKDQEQYGKKLINYECITDQCNSLSQLKRILTSLTMNDNLIQLADLLNPVKPFQGQWCYRFSNATFDQCNITIPDSSCTQCTLDGMTNQTGTELCATCSTDEPDATELGNGMSFNMTDRTYYTLWTITCEQENCSTPAISDRIREKSYISFDFDKFLNAGNKPTPISSISKMILLFVVFLMKLFH